MCKSKTCRICKNTYPKTEEFFRKNGKSWRSGCKKCINKNLPKKTKEQKKIEKAKTHKIWAKKNRLKRNEYAKEYRKLNPDKYNEYKKNRRKTCQKKRDELSDEYLLRLICRRTGFSRESITKEVVEQKKLIIKLKRQINYGQSKKS